MKKRYQVVIVGGGPVGVALAFRARPARPLLRAGRAAARAAAYSQGTKSHAAFGRALLFLGRVGRAARRAHSAAGLSDERHRRLPRFEQRILGGAAAARDCQSLLFSEQRVVAAISGRMCFARARLKQLDNVEARFGWV